MQDKSSVISVLIIDQSADMRDIISDVINSNSDMKVTDTASNAHIGSLKAFELNPDVIIIDISLKDLDPAGFTKTILEKHKKCGIFLTIDNEAISLEMDNSIQALNAGAFDIIVKPDIKLSEQMQKDFFNRKLLIKIREYSIKRYYQIAMEAAGKTEKTDYARLPENYIAKKDYKNASKYKVLLIGVSTGGPKALCSIIPQLPEFFPLPIIIVLHLPSNFTAGMAHELDNRSRLKVMEAKEGDIIRHGNIYLAKGGRHLFIDKNRNNDYLLKYNDSPPVNNCRPSVDILFESAAEIFKDKAIGIILTGMGNDGAKGIEALKKYNAKTFAQDKETSVVWGMPGSAVNTGCIDEVLPLNMIFMRVLEIV